MGRIRSKNFYSHYDLAGIYAFLGEKEKAYDILRILRKREEFPIVLYKWFKMDPLFDGIRNEPEFKQIEIDLDARYQAEHERVRKWFEENNML